LNELFTGCPEGSNDLRRDVPKRFRFLDAERFGTILAVPPLEASSKEKFDTLFGLLKENYAGVFDFEFKNVTVLTLLLGWSLASKDARSFLHSHPEIAYCACGALFLYVFLLSVSFGKFYRRSRITFGQLSELGYMPTEYFRVRRIQLFTVVTFTVLNWIVALIMCAVIAPCVTGLEK
jgi:hypothetical protein